CMPSTFWLGAFTCPGELIVMSAMLHPPKGYWSGGRGSITTLRNDALLRKAYNPSPERGWMVSMVRGAEGKCFSLSASCCNDLVTNFSPSALSPCPSGPSFFVFSSHQNGRILPGRTSTTSFRQGPGNPVAGEKSWLPRPMAGTLSVLPGGA